tara:strand:+ start:267 stop:533 length:267 start_codon:yes stop_codon:yes gene_type:complete
MEKVIEKENTLTQEEKLKLEEIQNKTQQLILELGEIEMIKLQIDKRHNQAKNFLESITIEERNFTDSLFEKYGKVTIDPENGTLTKLD